MMDRDTQIKAIKERMKIIVAESTKIDNEIKKLRLRYKEYNNEYKNLDTQRWNLEYRDGKLLDDHEIQKLLNNKKGI